MSSDPEEEIGPVERPLNESNIAQDESGGLPERYLLPSGPSPQTESMVPPLTPGSIAMSNPRCMQACSSASLEHSPARSHPMRDSPRVPGPQQQVLQHRMEDMRSSLEVLSIPSTTEPSPGAPLMHKDHQTASFLLNEHELANMTDMDSLPSPQSLPRGASGQLTDRATSPSAASVISMASSTASGFTTGRKNLEWDSGADLGYLGEVQPQKEAAGSLCPLEKIAIGNYSSFLQCDMERKHEKALGNSNTQHNVRNHRQNEEEEMHQRQRLIHTFAQRLTRRDLSRFVTDSPPGKCGRNRSNSRDKGSTKSTSDSSPSYTSSKKNMSHISAPIRAHSLNDLKSLQEELVSLKFRNHRSSSDMSQYAWLASNSLRHYLYGSEEPSSCSSTGTVVPLQDTSLDTGVDLQVINTDLKSLPVQLQGIYHVGGHQHEADLQDVASSLSQASTVAARSIASMTRPNESQNSLHSHQSASRSFETVINVSDPLQRHPEKNRWVTHDNLHSDSGDADEEVESIDKGKLVTGRQGLAESDENDTSPPPTMKMKKRHIAVGPSRPNSVLTTSDEDSKQNYRSRHCARESSSRERLPSTNTATSTMESALIDRAKSFEYFPGEHFPIQENSSSYEYLPGHLIIDRPGTVVSNYGGEDKGRESKSLSGVNSTSSDVIKSVQEKRPKSSFAVGARRRTVLGQDLASDLQAVSSEFTDHPRDLYDVHMRKKRRFYKKVKKYISVVATASETPEDNKVKQDLLEKLLALITKQESLIQEKHTAMGVSYSKDCKTVEATIDTPLSRTKGLRDVATNTLPLLEKPPLIETSSSSSSSPNLALDAYLKKIDTSSSPITKRPDEDIQMHQTRIEQMRTLRKEIKKLEKQEYAQLGQALQDAGGGLTFLGGGPTDVSDTSSLLSTSTCPSELVTKTVTSMGVTSKRVGRSPPPSNVKQAEETKAFAALESKSCSKMKKRNLSNGTAGNQRTFTRNVSANKVIEGQAHQQGQIECGLTGHPNNILDRGRENRSPLKVKVKKSDFGQSFPTPRDSTALATIGVIQSTHVAVQSEKYPESSPQNMDTLNDYSLSPFSMSVSKPHTPRRTPIPSKMKQPRKPIAFYLSLNNESPTQIGTQLLRERNPEEEVGKENRNTIVNQKAGLDTHVLADGREKRHKSSNISIAGTSTDDTCSSLLMPMTLTIQDALEMKRPDFVARANQRTYLLHRARDQRLQYEERMHSWLKELSIMPSHLQKIAVPNFSPIKIKRVFNYKEMVESTRRKYLNLPEVQNQLFESKKKTSYRTNRLMKEIYKTKLQENVLGGRVSLPHYKNVFI